MANRNSILAKANSELAKESFKVANANSILAKVNSEVAHVHSILAEASLLKFLRFKLQAAHLFIIGGGASVNRLDIIFNFLANIA